MPDPRLTPKAIHVERTEHLRVTWADGHVSTYPLRWLQRFCASASCGVTRGNDPGGGGGLLPILSTKAVTRPNVTDVKLVGTYGIRFTFNNCDPCTSIYTFDYLRSICPAENPNAQPKPVVHGIEIRGLAE